MTHSLSTASLFSVLAVENGLVDARLVGELLEGAGAGAHELIHVRNLGDAIATLVERDVDLVLVKLQLPDSSGLESFVRLQATAPGVPIIPHNGLIRRRIGGVGPVVDIAEARRPPGLRGSDIRRCLQRAVRRRVMERSLLHLATHDQLTGVANRLLLEDRLRQAVARARRSGLQGLLAFVDLDGFKQINDTHGHETGDRVLVAIARRLSENLRETDTVARFGGDEFIVLVEGLSDGDAAEALMTKLAALLAEPVNVDGLALHPSASIGVAFFPTHGEDMPTLIRQADGAMYDAKRAGPGLFRYAPPTMPPTMLTVPRSA